MEDSILQKYKALSVVGQEVHMNCEDMKVIKGGIVYYRSDNNAWDAKTNNDTLDIELVQQRMRCRDQEGGPPNVDGLF